MRSNISLLTSSLYDNEILLMEFLPGCLDLSIARLDANGQQIITVTRRIDQGELERFPADLIDLVFTACRNALRAKCRELGLLTPEVSIWTETLKAWVEGSSFLWMIHQDGLRAQIKRESREAETSPKSCLSQGKPRKPRKLPPPPHKESGQ